MSLINLTRQSSGLRAWFAVSKNGVLRTGLASGAFTATVMDSADSASATYAVSESTQKPGIYFFDIPASFILSSGVDEYAYTIEVSAAGPALKAVYSGTFEVPPDHVREDALTWDGNNRPLTFRRRTFSDATAANASTPGATGEDEIKTETLTATHVDANRWESLLRTRS